MPTRAHPVTASGTVGVRTVHGWQFAENAATAAAARVLLRDGGATGAIFVDIRLAASESAGESYVEEIGLTGNLYVEVAVGTVRGSIYGG